MAGNAPRNESQVQYHRRRLEELKTVRSPWEKTWSGLADFIEPSRLRLNNVREGAADRSKIIDSTGTFALRTLASGMHSGVTSPARPWFRLGFSDPELREFAPVKQYLSTVENRMREVFQASNVYTNFHHGYGDMGQFGQFASLLVEDADRVVRMIPMLHGRFWLARDHTGRATTLYRQFRWSVQRIVGRFGYKNVSQTIQSCYDQGKYDDTFVICHAVEPRMTRDPNKPDKRNKRFLSNYWEGETSSRQDQLLEESGFDRNPIIAPAWELSGEDNYALSPAQVALGDVKMLQKEQQRKLEAIDKMVRPPMTGPTSMRSNPASLMPGSVTYVDDVQGKGYRPAMELNLRIAELMNDINGTQDRINRAFYADLFLMLANMEGIQPRNSMEIAERKEEKLLALGPVLENIYGGQLGPTIENTFEMMEEAGRLPPPPAEIEGMDVKIEYISVLAQAQKAVSTGGIERVAAFAGNMMGVKPDLGDKIDFDQAMDRYAEYIGVPPDMIVPDEDVAKIRADRAQQQQQAKQAEMAAQLAPAAKQGAEAARVLSEASRDPSGSGLLQQIGMT